MRLWLPDPLYRLKPFLIVLAGVIILYVSNSWLTLGLGFLCLGIGAYIVITRLMWSNTGVIKTSSDYTRAGEQKIYDVRTSRK